LQRLASGNVDLNTPGTSNGQARERRAVNFQLVSSTSATDGNGHILYTISYQLLRPASDAIDLVAVVDAQSGLVKIYEGSVIVPGQSPVETGWGTTPNTMLRGIIARSRLISECSNGDFVLREVTTIEGDIQMNSKGGSMFQLEVVDTRQTDPEEAVIIAYQFDVPINSYGMITWSWVNENGDPIKIGNLRRSEVERGIRIYTEIQQAVSSRGWNIESVDPTLSSFSVKDPSSNHIIATIAQTGWSYMVTIYEVQDGDVRYTIPLGNVAGYNTIHVALDAIESTLAFFAARPANLAASAHIFESKPTVVAWDEEPIFVGKPSQAMLTSLHIDPAADIRIGFVPKYNQVLVDVDGYWTSAVQGGMAKLVTIIEAFGVRFPHASVFTLKTGKHTHLVIECNAVGADFGDGLVLDPSFIGQMGLDITETSRSKSPVVSGSLSTWVAVLTGSALSHPINFMGRISTIASMQSLGQLLNGIIRSGLDFQIIDAGGQKSALGLDEKVILSVVFVPGQAEMKVIFAVESDGKICYTFKKLVTSFRILPTPELMRGRYPRETYPTRTTFEDSAETVQREVRFDEWLIHHMLGIAYSGYKETSNPMYIGATKSPDAAYWTLLASAYDIIGVATQDTLIPGVGSVELALQTTENVMVALPWFLLFSQNGGNRLEDQNGNDVSFQSWMASNVDESLLQMSRDAFRALTPADFASFLGNNQAYVWTWFKTFALDDGVGGGFVIPPDSS
jgi:hypothetical protein